MIQYILAFIAFLGIYDYVNFFLIKRRLKGPFKVRKGSEPLFLKGNKKGILLLHGFSSCPGELKSLANYLHRKKYTVYAPLLPGHGTTPEMLAITKWRQWVSSTEEAIDLLSNTCKEIWILGNSMGGNLALINANKNKKIKGIITISTPIFYKRKYRLARIIFPLMKRIKFFQKKKYSDKFKKRIGKKRKYAYNMVPLRSLVHLIKTIKESKKALPKIKKEILICQASPDEIMDIKSGNFIYDNVKSKSKKIIKFPNALHLILLDPLYKREVHKKIYSFIKDGR